jgi:hypothetical protein
MNGMINSRQATLIDEIFFSLVLCRLGFAGTIVFADVCFLITVVSRLVATM